MVDTSGEGGLTLNAALANTIYPVETLSKTCQCFQGLGPLDFWVEVSDVSSIYSSSTVLQEYVPKCALYTPYFLGTLGVL